MFTGNQLLDINPISSIMPISNDGGSQKLPPPQKRFPLYSILRHYKGGIYYVVGLPERTVLEATREDAYAYLMADGAICVRNCIDMEQHGKFVELTASEIQALPAGTLDFIVDWTENQMNSLLKSHANFVKYIAVGSTGPL